MAGAGDLCVMVRSREAALALREHKFVPVDLALVGIVTSWSSAPTANLITRSRARQYT
jgi:microcompartment protein CcmK/EutM